MTELIIQFFPPSIMMTEAMNETNINGVTNQCIVCQVDSMEQDCEKVKAVSSESKFIDHYIKCDSCHSKTCADCIRGLYTYIENSGIPSSATEHDSSFQALSRMNSLLSNKKNSSIKVAPCCLFKLSIPQHSKASTTRPPRPPTIPVHLCSTRKRPLNGLLDYLGETDCSDTDDDGDFLLENKSQVHRKWKRSVKRAKVEHSQLEDLHQYHNGHSQSPRLSLSVCHSKDILKEINRKRKSNRKRKAGAQRKIYRHNIFEGALNFPMFDLAIESDASENHLTCDHMALAESVGDGSPAVMHGVYSLLSSQLAFDHMNKLSLSPLRIQGNRQTIVLPNVPSPEDLSKGQERIVEVIIVRQKRSVKDCAILKRENEFTPQYILSQQMFGNDDICKKVVATIILGDFCLEEDNHPPKLLLLRLSSMFSNLKYTPVEKTAMSCAIHDSIRSLSGKMGYEMRRFGGSSGMVTYQSDADLLRVLADHRGACPRKTWGSVILRGTDRYFVVYHRCNPDTSSSTFTHVEYCPPKDGGQFTMPDVFLSMHPILGDVTYCKMLSVMILNSLNEYRLNNNEEPTAVGPIEHEMKNIDIARQKYSSSSKSKRMHNFIVAFNHLNRYSMVAYPVGMHEDHFTNGECLENKILFTLPRPRNGSLGRGGSLLGDRFVFALLDWT